MTLINGQVCVTFCCITSKEIARALEFLTGRDIKSLQNKNNINMSEADQDPIAVLNTGFDISSFDLGSKLPTVVLEFLEVNGLFVAYGFLCLAAVLPIILGSYGSVKYPKVKKEGDDEDSDDEEDESESLSAEDAMWFPIMGSCTLFGLYLMFRYFGKEYINYLLTAYFSVLGAVAVGK